jgi:hypothetical protein
MMMQTKALFTGMTPKDGLLPEQCEDYALASPNGTVACVSDGATHSIFSRLWARCLVERFHEHPSLDIHQEWLTPASVRFFRSLDLSSMPWHAQAQLGAGTFATLCGLILDPEQATAEAVVVGDSCMVKIDPSGAIEFFPAYDSGDLQLDPFLLSTLSALNETSLDRRKSWGPIQLEPGRTVFLLFTDAVARWLLDARDSVAGYKYLIELLLGCRNANEFEELIGMARADGMKNDDCSLVIVEAIL